MKKYLLLIYTTFCCLITLAQSPDITRIEPPSWWVGMNHHELQLLVQGATISSATVTLNYPGVKIDKINKADNKNFLFIDLILAADVKPGKFNIEFKFPGKKKASIYTYELNARENNTSLHNGLDQQDVIYLITPDRFANGNSNNDDIKKYSETKNRSFHGGRHGGDIEGMISKIPYLKDLGITTVWSSPLVENNMPEYSYHGYAITDYYTVDARFGTNALYKKMSDALHNNKMKLVMDMVFNHCGLEHWWMKDMPFTNWIHNYPKFTQTNHAMASLSDPHGAQRDREQMEQGWFVATMPDLNEDNPYMANYLIQNSIWWIEYAGLDGIRQDTYPYNKKEFMARWARHIHDEYPGFFLVGESWMESEALEAYWSDKGKNTTSDYNSTMNSMTDFPLCFAMHKAFKKDGDMGELYKVLSKDFLYYNANANKIFADNHDMDRIFYTLAQDVNKLKMTATFLLTTRGIPQLYYGDEICMMGHTQHGDIRQDFPGGWPGDSRNAFTAEGRTPLENEYFNHLQKLLQWRKNSDAIKNGSLKHFVPNDNIYVYNRKSEKESIVVLINNTNQVKKIDTDRYKEILNGYSEANEILTDKTISNLQEIEIAANTAMILKLVPAQKTGSH